MPSLYELLIILLIVALLFGTKKLRSIGGDLGSAVKSFRTAIKEEEAPATEIPATETEAPGPKGKSREEEAPATEAVGKSGGKRKKGGAKA